LKKNLPMDLYVRININEGLPVPISYSFHFQDPNPADDPGISVISTDPMYYEPRPAFIAVFMAHGLLVDKTTEKIYYPPSTILSIEYSKSNLGGETPGYTWEWHTNSPAPGPIQIRQKK